MPNITVDGIEYNGRPFRQWKSTASVIAVSRSPNAEIEVGTAVYQTARNSYIAALRAELEDS